MATEKTTKVYPGNLDRYTELREAREQLQSSTGPEDVANLNLLLAATIAEELAGLAYILDGIRYSARKNS